jgi:hypothetical protein
VPEVVLVPEVRWVLLRAFGPADAPFLGRLDPPRALSAATDLGLVERIGARASSAVLVAELGRDVCHQLAVSRLRALAGVRRLCALLPELAGIAEAARIPIVLLKFAAMHARGALADGSRAAGDLDVLVRERDAEPLAEILLARGFRAAATTMADHHLPPLQDAQGRVVEVHTCLPGLRPPGRRRFARFEDVQAAGGLEPARGLGGACHLPRRDLMAGHVVAHGLAHHGGADAYPVTRMLADLIDLLPGDRHATGRDALAWVARDVSRGRLEAVLGLCDALERGDLDGLGSGTGPRPRAVLLHHVLAGALDPRYRSTLAAGSLLRPLTDQARWRRFVRMVRYSVFPSNAQLAVRFGLPGAAHVDRRLRRAHAVHLLRRLPRLARAALRVTWARPG